MKTRLTAAAALLLLAACHGGVARHTTAVPGDWQQRRAALTALQHWDLRGRIRVHDGARAHVGKIGWQQDGSHYTLDIAPPVGGTGYRLTGDPAGVTWQGPGEPVRHAVDAGALMQATLGWSVPLSGARYWVVGLPDPSLPVDTLRFDTAGRLRVLNQAGWQVHIEDYLQVEALELPARLDLAHRDGLELRLAIHRWRLGDTR